MDEDFANADREAVLAAYHEEYVGFYSSPDGYGSETYQDFGPDAFSDPGTGRWDDYEVYVSPDLAVIYGNRTFVHPVHGSFKSFGTALFIKEDGQWMLIHGHNSYAGP
jgi:hypothetical protein